MKLIQLTSMKTGGVTFISPLAITNVRPFGDGSEIYLEGHESPIRVREDAATVATLFGDATE